MRLGRRIAIDVGKVRVGVAASDLHGILASGLATLNRANSTDELVSRIVSLIQEVEPIDIYVGLPVSMSGAETESTRDALDIARAISLATSIPVRLIDERLTTVSATSALRLSGRDSKSGRQIIDQVAATIILEQALASEKKSGVTPGTAIEEFDE